MGLFSKKDRRRSPSPSAVEGNPYAMYNNGRSAPPEDLSSNPVMERRPARNPYALNTSPYNSTPKPFTPPTRNSPSPAAEPSPAAKQRADNPYVSAPTNPYASAPNSYAQDRAPAANPYTAAPANPYVSAPSNPYATARAPAQPAASMPPSRGGLRRQPSQESVASSADPSRSELFKGRRQPAYVQAQQLAKEEPVDYDPSIMETEEERNERLGYPAYGAGGEDDDSYESRQRQLQLDEEEEAEISAIKGQIRYIKNESLTSARNARQYAEEAEMSGMRTLGMLGEQSDMIANAEQSVSITENQVKIAEDMAKELKTLNRSMFAVHVSNPFNSRRRLQEREMKIRNTFQSQQAAREAQRAVQYESQQRVAGALGNVPGERRRLLTETERKYREQMEKQKQSLSSVSSMQFEPDEEDFQIEADIDGTLNDISAATTRLQSMALAINKEVRTHNDRVGRLNERTRDVEVDVHLNTTRLATIR
ncbi:uncharacterized protein V1510DRAFT_411002 [Dipodascopsis tothii]|uniref:uncharacterized protein n=1 Tax=Dipodascopsis tothii TaxID=44089 RepID=UPI0034CE957B